MTEAEIDIDELREAQKDKKVQAFLQEARGISSLGSLVDDDKMVEQRLARIEQAIKQLYEIDRRYATPPAEAIKGALEDILNEQQ